MPEIGLDDVWIFIYRHKETRYTDLINAFVKTGKCAKQTLLNYKRELEIRGKIKKKISEETRRPVYYIPEEFKVEVKDLIDKLQIKEQIDKWTPEEFAKFKKEFYDEFFA